jgi:hypothetical protein
LAIFGDDFKGAGNRTRGADKLAGVTPFVTATAIFSSDDFNRIIYHHQDAAFTNTNAQTAIITPGYINYRHVNNHLKTSPQ